MENSTILGQTKDLTRKNIKLFKTNSRYVLAILLTPIISVLYVANFDSELTTLQENYKVKDFPIDNINKIPKCIKPQNCVTVGYYTFGPKKKWIDSTMKIFSKNSGLNFDQDVRYLGRSNPQKLKNEMKFGQRNRTQTIIIFCTKSWDVEFNTTAFVDKTKKIEEIFGKRFTRKIRNSTTGKTKLKIPCNFQKMKGGKKKLIFYTIAYNNSLEYQNPYFVDQNMPYPMSKIAFSVKKYLDEAIMNKFKKPEFGVENNFKFNVSQQPYPKLGLKIKRGGSFVSNVGSFFFSLSTSVSP